MKLPKIFKNTQTEEAIDTSISIQKPKPKNVFKLVKIVLGSVLVGLVTSAFLTVVIIRKVNTFFENNYFEFHQIFEFQFNKPISIETRIKPMPLIVYEGEELKRDIKTGIVNAPEPKSDRQKTVASVIDWVWGEDANTGRWLAYCESSYGRSLENSESTASGVFMFIDGTWRAERSRMGADQALQLKLDTIENVRTAYSHYKSNGLAPWEASRGCWGRMK